MTKTGTASAPRRLGRRTGKYFYDHGKIVELLRSGQTQGQVATAMGCSRELIRQVANKSGMPFVPGTRSKQRRERTSDIAPTEPALLRVWEAAKAAGLTVKRALTTHYSPLTKSTFLLINGRMCGVSQGSLWVPKRSRGYYRFTLREHCEFTIGVVSDPQLLYVFPNAPLVELYPLRKVTVPTEKRAYRKIVPRVDLLSFQDRWDLLGVKL